MTWSGPRALASAGASALLVTAAAMSAGCGAPTYVVVNVSVAAVITADALDVTATYGEVAASVTVAAAGGAPFELPTAFVLRPRGAVAGTMEVCVTTVGAVPVSTGCGSTEIVLGEANTVNVVLTACGDGSIDVPEECDGTSLGGADCATIGGGFTTGTLACNADCTFDPSGCSDCGNLVREALEPCDGTDLGGMDCTAFGFDAGVLACAPDCTLDASGCWSCGDGTTNPGESCDGADLAGQTCVGLAMGFDGGSLACDAACAYDTAACCTGTTPCFSGMTPATAPCNTGPPVADCGATPLDAAWDYCNCAGAPAAGSVFIEPSATTGPVTSVIVAGAVSFVSLQMDGCCFGTTGTTCTPTGATCDPLATVVRWDPIGCALGPCNLCSSGMHTLNVYNADVGAPCDTGDGGSLLFTTTYTVP